MTTKEKLELAIKELEKIANGEYSNERYFAALIYNKLTARTEEVEVKMWKCRDCGHVWDYMPRICPYTSEDYCCNGKNFIELTGTYQRPIPKPETWEGVVILDPYERPCILSIPREWIGKKVIVEVCE